MSLLSPLLGTDLGFLFILATLATIIVNVGFAIGIFKDADRLLRDGHGPFFVSPSLWALTTVIGGLTAVAIYWVMHYSRLRQPRRNP